MKLDPTVMRTMNRQDFRVLAAVETGMRNHVLVPAALVASIANLRHGGTGKIMSSLLRDKLLSHDRSCGYDGYRLTNSGYDILALHNLKSRGLIAALGDRIGTGKESDVYVAATPEGKQIVLKFHRLGRTSFRDVKKKRDYFMVNAVSKNKRNPVAKAQPNSWLFLSRISALKEFAFMKALHQVNYPTPSPIGHNRHIVAMGLVRGVPLYQIHTNRVSAEQAESIFFQSTKLATRLAKHGLVHCDLNEFNLMVDLSGMQNTLADDNDVAEHYVRHSGMSVQTKGALSARAPLEKHHIDGTGEIVTEAPPEPKEFLENGEPKPIVTLIDFPQMVSTRHPNAKELYDRDMQCLKRFFVMKLRCIPDSGWEELIPNFDEIVVQNTVENTEERDQEDAADSDVCIASKAQLRLDEELQASGFSTDDSKRDMELFYYETSKTYNMETQIENDEHDGSDYSDIDDNDADEGGEKFNDNLDEDGDSLSEHSDQDNLENDHDVTTEGVHITDGSSGLLFGEERRAAAEEKAKARVRYHLEDRKKKGGRKNAFRSRNTNKTYVKGKRVMKDDGIF
mmetsp:Transcript_26468/g.37320  ORF Transcript_26468/g.37320 Transcript_26468/m.37320 type:complete len:566 (-) Transcript_26468:44-1741(-)